MPSDPGGCCFLNRSFSYKSRSTASSASEQQVLLNSMWFLIAGSISDTSEFVCSYKLRIGQTPYSVPPRDTLRAHGPRQLRQPRSPRWAAGTVLELRGFATAGTVFPAVMAAAASSTTGRTLLMCHRSGWCPSWMPSAQQRSRRWKSASLGGELNRKRSCPS